jgi:hypothetical protein
MDQGRCSFCGRSQDEVGVLIHAAPAGVAAEVAVCRLCVESLYEILRHQPPRPSVPGRAGVSDHWLLEIGLPSRETRDALIEKVADGVASVTERPLVSIKSLEAIDSGERPGLLIVLRLQSAVTAADAEMATAAQLRHFAPDFQLSDATVTVAGRP